MQNETRLHTVMTWFERIIIAGLILLMAVTVLFSALDLADLDLRSCHHRCILEIQRTVR